MTTTRCLLPVPCAGASSAGHRRRTRAPRGAVAEPPQLVDEEASVLSSIQMWVDTARPHAIPKRLRTQVAEVARDTTVIRSMDIDRDRFDIEFGLSDGTTYNSYVVKGDKVAVVDVSHAKFGDAYFTALHEVVDPSSISYIVVSHTEPDHSGLVAPLLELAPHAVVVGTRVCLQFLSNLVSRPFEKLEVKAGSTLDLGRGHVLEFVPAPNLHWPDTMFSFDASTGALFTCDAFGAHYCSDAVFDTDLAALSPHFHFYYECLMKPNARSVLTALRKVEALPAPVRVVATGHGPVLRHNAAELLGRYSSWSTAALAKAASCVCVLYPADYGFADRLSQSLARGLTKTDAEVVMLDSLHADAQEVAEAVAKASALVVLCPPSSSSSPVSPALAAALASVRLGQRVLLAESYGGSDEPVDTLAASLISAGASIAGPALRVRELPGEGVYQAYEEAGTDLGQALRAGESLKAQKGGMPAALSKALGRLSGGLYVVTASRGDARSAMVASWVAQAAFSPPSITVAVAKDRAIERLMQVGDSFVLNCLPEGGETAPLMKHFLRRFAPGADRFGGVAWTPASGCGAPILDAAVAFVECTVASRMEAGDHWVVLATVSDGSVMRPDVKTAVHTRKIGSYY